MRLLTVYLTAVGSFLHGRQRRDILRELEENLRSQIEDQEAELGRPLTEREQQAVLLAHGTPLEVAARYGGRQGTLTFGRQLIGPEFFPIYRIVLIANWLISAMVHAGMALSRVQVDEPRAFFVAAGVQFVVITFIFCVVDFLQRRSGGVPPALGDNPGQFPPTYLRDVPRWQSANGFLAWLALSVWWALIPSYPMLVIGTAANFVQLSPAWEAFYWPILLLLVAGLAQRAANYVHPEWNWLPPVARLGINLAGLLLIYPIHLSAPYFTAGGTATALPGSGPAAMARALDAMTWWALVAGFSFFLLTQIALNGWMCLQHARFHQRQRKEQAS
jgi:hypothetical protein